MEEWRRKKEKKERQKDATEGEERERTRNSLYARSSMTENVPKLEPRLVRITMSPELFPITNVNPRYLEASISVCGLVVCHASVE